MLMARGRYLDHETEFGANEARIKLIILGATSLN